MQGSQSLEGEHLHILTMKPFHSGKALGLCVLLLLSALPVQADESVEVGLEIRVNWTADSEGNPVHAYLLSFADNASYQLNVSMEHVRNESQLVAAHVLEWGHENGARTALATFNTSLAWGDQITLEVHVTAKDGTPVDSLHRRVLTVGVWNQPMDDHEVMLTSSWSLEQAYDNGTGPQRFSLTFEGQGWQERIGDVLSSWELGNGTFQTLETTAQGETDLDLVLTQVWKNETIIAGVLTHQVFDARGMGTLETTLLDGATRTVVYADVSQAVLNRSLANGVVGERLVLEATGDLNVTEDGVENNSLNIDGELSVFFFEYHDQDGERVLQHTAFEAMADFVLIEDGTRLDVTLDGFTSHEKWENGVRTEHLEELYGDGTFGFEGEEENASVQVNGSILDLHTKIENGTTTVDDLHVDGVLTGDVQGTFGVLRGIETTGMQTNATGEAFLVNVIFQESWFNITGVNGGNFFDGAGIGTTHNETWDYQAVQSDWDNRTVRLVWRETGPDASEGETFPEHSPIQQDPTPPVSEEGLGDVTVGRETGLMPIPMQSHDHLTLNGQDGLSLTLVAGATDVDARDGHNLTVIEWAGTYGGAGESGTAAGTIVSVGPLSGLLSSVERNLSLPFGEGGETILLRESQHLERVLSPEIVGEDENNPPSIGTVGLREGLVVGEGGSFAHLEVEVIDSEWNVVEVVVDLSSLGLGSVTLNDRGLEGDLSIGDDVYTSTFCVPGLEVGDYAVNVTAIDSFGAVNTKEGSVTVVNQAPRLLSVEFAPASLERGQSTVVNVQTYDGHGVSNVQLDLRPHGGTLVNLTEVAGVWTAMVPLPSGFAPGVQSITVVVEDGLGASERFQTFSRPDGAVGDPERGPHHVSVFSEEAVQIEVLNDRPLMQAFSMTFEKDPKGMTVYTAIVTDPDGVERVQIDLGVYAPVGQISWVSMHDDGVSGGDQTAGDGVYSVILSVRDGTPLGTHEINVRSFDTFGEMNTTSAAVQLVERDASGGEGPSSNGTAVTVLGVLLLISALAVLGMMTRRRGDEGRGPKDRFGMQ